MLKVVGVGGQALKPLPEALNRGGGTLGVDSLLSRARVIPRLMQSPEAPPNLTI